jgi:hypothetical protein
MNFKQIKAIGAEIKISFEDEGLTFDQATRITCAAHASSVPVNIKIGGAEAISDMRVASTLGCTGCVAPMIESSYALHKFISAIHKNNFNFDHLYVNIESAQAYANIENILKAPDSKYLHGIVLGRTDFIQSFGLTKNKVDSKECLDMAENIFTLAKQNNLITVMGGNINSNSKAFVQELYTSNLLDYIETRNVKVKLSESFMQNYNANLSAMLEFESEWLEVKYKTLDILAKEDKNRWENLKTRNK